MKGSRVVLIALGALAAWHLALRWRSLPLPLMSDEGEYAYEARLLSGGGLPYRDAFDQKPPVVFFLYRVAFGVFGHRDVAPRLLALLFSWMTMVLLFASTPRSWSWTARIAAPAAFGALSTAPIGDLGFAANTEIFLCGWTALGAWCLLRAWEARRPPAWTAAAGLALGAAFMTKQTACWTLAGFAVMAATGSKSRRERLQALGAFFGGAAVVPALCLLYFAARGGAGVFIDQAFGRNMDYATLVLSSLSVFVQIGWLVKTLGPLFLSSGWPAYLLAVIGLVLSQTKAGANFETLATLWLGCALVGVCTGFFFFPHYFVQALPPLALATALGARWVEKQLKLLSRGPWIAVFLSLYPAIAQARMYWPYPFYGSYSPERLARELLYPNPLFESRMIGDYLKEQTKPDDRIYVFGSEPQIYFYADRLAATPHIFVFPLTLFPRDPAQIDAELARLSSGAPKFIVYVDVPASILIGSKLGERFRNGVLELLGRRYRWVGAVDMRGPESKAVFVSGEDESIGTVPNWTAEPQLFVFERR